MANGSGEISNKPICSSALLTVIIHFTDLIQNFYTEGIVSSYQLLNWQIYLRLF